MFSLGQGLMDYSLLVGVKRQRFEVIKEPLVLRTSSKHSMIKSNPFQKQDDGGIAAAIVEGPGMFYFGIIDILQEWNLKKKVERFLKVVLFGSMR